MVVFLSFRGFKREARKAILENTMIDVNNVIYFLWEKIIIILDEGEGKAKLNRRVGEIMKGFSVYIQPDEKEFLERLERNIIPLLQVKSSKVVLDKGSVRFYFLRDIKLSVDALNDHLSKALNSKIEYLPCICYNIESNLFSLKVQMEKMDEVFAKPDEILSDPTKEITGENS